MKCRMALPAPLIGLGAVFQKAIPDKVAAANDACHHLHLVICWIKPVAVRLLHEYILPQDMGFVWLCYTKSVSFLLIQTLCEHKGVSAEIFISSPSLPKLDSQVNLLTMHLLCE